MVKEVAINCQPRPVKKMVWASAATTESHTVDFFCFYSLMDAKRHFTSAVARQLVRIFE